MEAKEHSSEPKEHNPNSHVSEEHSKGVCHDTDKMPSSSSVDDDGTKEQKKRKKDFPWKLHVMLDDAIKEGNEHIVSWDTEGKSFKVHESESFVKQILPRYFNQTQFRSFQRMLNLYSFQKVMTGPFRGGYSHPHFNRQDKHQSLEMRIRPKGSAARSRRRFVFGGVPKIDNMSETTSHVGASDGRMNHHFLESLGFPPISVDARTASLPTDRTTPCSNEAYLDGDGDSGHEHPVKRIDDFSIGYFQREENSCLGSDSKRGPVSAVHTDTHKVNSNEEKISSNSARPFHEDNFFPMLTGSFGRLAALKSAQTVDQEIREKHSSNVPDFCCNNLNTIGRKETWNDQNGRDLPTTLGVSTTPQSFQHQDYASCNTGTLSALSSSPSFTESARISNFGVQSSLQPQGIPTRQAEATRTRRLGGEVLMEGSSIRIISDVDDIFQEPLCDDLEPKHLPPSPKD